MRSVRRSVFAILTSAVILSSSVPVQNVSAENTARPIRVGLYYSSSSKDTRQFSSYNKSDNGFEIGISGGTSFSKLFELGIKELVIAPSGNLYIKSGINALYSGTGGAFTFGGYHVQLSGSYGSYASANEAASKTAGSFVAYTGSAYVVRTGSYTSSGAAEAACASQPGSKAVSPAPTGLTLCDTNGKKILLEFEGEKCFALRARSGGTVTVFTSSSSFPYYGFFEYKVVNKKLCLVNVVDLEQYVKGVLPNEAGTSASDEVTKAFSILIRTFAVGRKHSGSGYDVCNSTCCQVYRGANRETDRINKIVDSTKGKIITYNGGMIKCFYNVSNGGASCSSAAAWGGTPIPYLSSVKFDEGDGTVVWKEAFTKAELYSYLKGRPAFSSLRGGITSIQILEKDPSGSDFVTAFAATDNYGNTVTVRNAEAVKGSLGFTSSNFKIKYSFSRNVQSASGCGVSYNATAITADGTKEFKIGETRSVIGAGGKVSSVTADRIVFDGKGKGHGVGYSQIGAEALVKKGYDYASTITFYFPGTVITNIG